MQQIFYAFHHFSLEFTEADVILVLVYISAMGPVRLFTPYKRRRRTYHDGEEKKPKVRRENSLGDGEVDNIHQSSNNSNSKEAWQSIAEGLESNADYHLLENPDNNTDPIAGKLHDFISYNKILTLPDKANQGKRYGCPNIVAKN